MISSKIILRLCGAAAGLLCGISCVSVNTELGQDFLAMNMQYDIKTDSFGLSDVQLQTPDDLSGYSLYRFTVGAIRDDVFGLTERSCAFTLVPVNDTLDFGKKGTLSIKRFHFSGIPDTVSVAQNSQRYILQNIHVHPLVSPLEAEKAVTEVYYDGRTPSPSTSRRPMRKTSSTVSKSSRPRTIRLISRNIRRNSPAFTSPPTPRWRTAAGSTCSSFPSMSPAASFTAATPN